MWQPTDKQFWQIQAVKEKQEKKDRQNLLARKRYRLKKKSK
jgi:hypothetical protein